MAVSTVNRAGGVTQYTSVRMSVSVNYGTGVRDGAPNAIGSSASTAGEPIGLLLLLTKAS